MLTDKPWLMLGDCLEKMKEIPNDSVNLVIADPPYTMTKRGRSCRPNWWMSSGMGENVFQGEIPPIKEWLKECFRCMSSSSHIYVFTNTNDLLKTLQEAKNVGFRFHNLISMIKDTGMPNRWYYKQTELLLFFRKGKAKPINDVTSRDNVRVTMPKLKTGKMHITQKPLDFIEKLVTNSSQNNEIVLDPFMGSGTTGVACLNTCRKFIGIEKDEKYFQIAEDRIAKAQAERDSLLFAC